MADEKEVLEVGKNCAECKKPMKKAKRYYRNGAYYCNKNCFKKKLAGEGSEAEAKAEKK